MEVEKRPIKAFGDLLLDTDAKLLWQGETPVAMPLKEIELLSWLVLSRGRLVTKEELINRLWAESFVEESNLSRHVYLLRKTLKNLGCDGLIETVPRRGYRFVGEVEDVEPNDLVIEHRSITRTVVEEIDRSDAPPRRKERFATISPRFLVATALAVGLLLVFLGGSTWWRGIQARSGSPGPNRSLAVLPFRVIDQNDTSRRDGLGFADDLITRLSNIRQINVRPTSAVAGFEDSNSDSTEIGRKLGVDTVLEGTVYHSGDRFRITMRLMDISGNKPVWSGQFERVGDDKLRIQDEIAVRVADALALNLNDGEKAALSKHYTDDDEAYQIYQKGRFEWNKRSWQGAIEAERLFRNAIARDPGFALAYVGLADQLATRTDATEAYVVIEKAIELDPSLGEAHATLGFLKMFHEWNWAGAESELKRSIELDPGYATAHHWYATLLMIQGRNREAEREFQRALEINPLSYNFLGDLGQLYYFDHDYEKATEKCRRALDIYPEFGFAHGYLADIDLMTGNFEEAMDENIKAERAAQEMSNRSSRLEIETERKDAVRLAEYKRLGPRGYIQSRVDHTGDPVNALSNARFYALLGDKESALSSLQTAVRIRAFTVVFAKVDPVFDNLHGDSRFAAILKQMNL